MTHNDMKKQQGASLLGVMFALVALIAIGIMLAHAARIYSYETTARVAFKRIEHIHDAMQRAYMDNVTRGTSPLSPTDLNAYPNNGASLMSLGYIEECSAANEIAGRCINALKLPWTTTSNADQMINIRRFLDSDNFPAFELSFSIAGLAPIQLRNAVRAKLTELPNFRDNGAGNITLKFTRPGNMVALENLVKRDGTTKMTKDWDFGGKYLENVKDIAIAGLTDRSVLTGTVKIGSKYVGNSSGERVDNPSCPDGYKPEIEVWLSSVGGSDSNQLPYNMRSFAAWYADNGNHWQVFVRSLGEDSNGNPRFFYQGTVSYATWCDFS